MPLRAAIQDDLKYLAEMLRYRRQTIQEAVIAGNEVVREIRRQNQMEKPK